METYTIEYTIKTNPEKRTLTKDQLASFIEEVSKEFSSGFAACWFYHKVTIGLIQSGSLQFEGTEPPNFHHLVRLRLFNQSKEWHIWKSGLGFIARMREDTDGTGEQENEGTPYVDNELVLWGTQTRETGTGFQQTYEERGTSLTLPASIGSLEKGITQKRFVLKTRNYIGFNKIGQAGYVDSRFVDIKPKTFPS